MKALLVAVIASGCTTPNPRSCADGACTDPRFPFCDVDGVFGGVKNECIAVECTPNDFAGCRGENEVRCNTSGMTYDVTKCQLGCDESLEGCRLCEPNQTACTNGMVASCDAAGHATVSETCALGCFESEPRCREIDPSNGLAMYLDTFTSAPDLDVDAPYFEVTTGEVRVGTNTIAIPSFIAHGQNGSPDIRVYVVGNAHVHGAARVGIDSDPRGPSGPAFALLALGSITIDDTLRIHPRVGVVDIGCTATSGTSSYSPSGSAQVAGGGGGGNAGAGARGGSINDPEGMFGASGGMVGEVTGTDAIVPLRGGCRGGFFDASPTTYINGGGAAQFVSREAITVNGTIDATGSEGDVEEWDQTVYGRGGGGAGGSLLLEAATVTLGPDAKILASGGRGAQSCTMPSIYCGARGLGATKAMPATAGMSIPFTSAANTPMAAGGGGGGLGRVRINTLGATYHKESSTVEDAKVTTGEVSTR